MSNNNLSALGNVVLKDQLNNFELFKMKSCISKMTKIFNKRKKKLWCNQSIILIQRFGFFEKKMELSSLNKTRILTDKNQLFNLSKFKYLINKQELRGKK